MRRRRARSSSPGSPRRSATPSSLRTSRRYTSRTITDRRRLDRALGEIRRTGYGTCVGELEEFQNGVSAAVLDRLMRPMVIVNIWGPSPRVTQKRLPVLGRMALRAAHEVSLVLA